MKHYIYLCITPESLVASHLPPAEFGNYLATGTRKRLRGQAIFFEVDPSQMNLPHAYLEEKLQPYPDGEPKRSLYLSIYRVLEHVPMTALKKLYLVTDDGKVLEVETTPYSPDAPKTIHLYQQLSPISTRVASVLAPPDFIRLLTDPDRPVHAPRIFMADLKLNKLAEDPTAPIHDLPYPDPDHLRECLSRLLSSKERLTKTVIRQFRGDLSYRTIESGFFLGDRKTTLYYPMPPVSALESIHYNWWRSALTQAF